MCKHAHTRLPINLLKEDRLQILFTNNWQTRKSQYNEKQCNPEHGIEATQYLLDGYLVERTINCLYSPSNKQYSLKGSSVFHAYLEGNINQLSLFPFKQINVSMNYKASKSFCRFGTLIREKMTSIAKSYLTITLQRRPFH